MHIYFLFFCLFIYTTNAKLLLHRYADEDLDEMNEEELMEKLQEIEEEAPPEAPNKVITYPTIMKTISN